MCKHSKFSILASRHTSWRKIDFFSAHSSVLFCLNSWILFMFANELSLCWCLSLLYGDSVCSLKHAVLWACLHVWKYYRFNYCYFYDNSPSHNAWLLASSTDQPFQTANFPRYILSISAVMMTVTQPFDYCLLLFKIVVTSWICHLNCYGCDIAIIIVMDMSSV